jgi:glycosyltransferase involved in cell wall biosynthesis
VNPVYFTICSANYLPYARALHASVREACGDAEFICFVVDEARERLDYKTLGFECIEVKDIGCSHMFDMAARYTIMEFNTAIKPFCMKWLLDNRREDCVVYLDPDVLVVSDLVELKQALADGASIVLTPHSLAPLDDGKDPDDIRLMRTGAYNLGFCAIHRSPAAFAFIDWWGKHLLEHCVVDLDNGIFVDQKFCDLAPCYFENVHVLRHPGYNVAYWNLLHRQIKYTGSAGAFAAGDQPLRFFHFSGVVPSDRTVFSKHQDRFTVRNIGDAKILLDRYIDNLNKHSLIESVNLFKLSYAYSTLANGLFFTDQMRKVYGDLNAPAPRKYEEAFNGDIGRFVTLSPAVKQDTGTPVTRLMHHIWSDRADLRAAFPLTTPAGREGFLGWFLATATRECRVPTEIVEATRVLKEPDNSIASTGDANAQPITAINYRSDRVLGTELSSWAPMRKIGEDSAIGLSMFGYFRAETGLGAAARANFMAARGAGVDVVAHNICCPGFENKIEPPFALAGTTETKDCVLFHVNADSVDQIETIVNPLRLRGKHRIGYWAWELASLPIEWVGAYRKVDEIWAPSRFAAHAFSQRTRMPITVIPHPVAVPTPPANLAGLRAKFGIPADRLTFLTAFDLNSYIDRKNPFAVLKSFKRAFRPSPDSPLLVVKLHGNFHRDSRFDGLVAAIVEDPRIVLIDRVLSNQEIGELQWCCDAFVSLHRSEGFGLWIAECMARGKPCIVTNYSGNTDFTNSFNAMPIGFSMVPVRRGEYPFGEGQWWADPDIEEAVRAMRKLVESSTLRERLGNAARRHILENLSPRSIGALISARLLRARAELIDLPQLIAS